MSSSKPTRRPWKARRLQIGQGRTKPGTINALAVRYYAPAEFRQFAASTKFTYRGIIERFRGEHGNKSNAELQRTHVKDMVAARADTPAAANNFLRMVRMLMAFAVDLEMRKDDPTRGIKPLKMNRDGFHTWTEVELDQYRAHHPIGSKARLAFA